MTESVIRLQQKPSLLRCKAAGYQGFPYMPGRVMPDVKNGLRPDFTLCTICYDGPVVELYDQGRNRRGQKK